MRAAHKNQLRLNGPEIQVRPGRPACDGFTLIEIMVVVTLMTVMILGLMAMFTQTQRAFRAGMSQTDILEGGRLVTDMMSREIEQVTPSGLDFTNRNTIGFFAAVINSTPPFSDPPVYTPLYQNLTGSPSVRRTNVLQDVFFTIRENREWKGIGYFVRTNLAYRAGWGPVGTLYRFETNNTRVQFEDPFGSVETALLNTYRSSSNRVSRLLDGVVHFQVRAYDIHGNWINPTNMLVAENVRTNFTAWSPASTPHDANYFFFSNGVPAYVEVELGLLEDDIYKRYQGIPDVAPPPPALSPRLRFLEGQGNRVHLFRQRIAIRRVDPSAYQ
jgi:hypothetical protein